MEIVLGILLFMPHKLHMYIMCCMLHVRCTMGRRIAKNGC